MKVTKALNKTVVNELDEITSDFIGNPSIIDSDISRQYKTYLENMKDINKQWDQLSDIAKLLLNRAMYSTYLEITRPVISVDLTLKDIIENNNGIMT